MDINIGINKQGNEDILLLELREHMVFGFEHKATILCIRTQEDYAMILAGEVRLLSRLAKSS